jgi:GT2 family glycosyltransferase
MMDVSIVIVSFNGRDLLRRCLASIYEYTEGLQFEVIIVDNASTDGTREAIAGEYPQAKLLARANNAGFSRAVNEGIAASRGNFLLILNPDCELTSNILPVMIGYLTSRPEIGLLGPKLLDPGGQLQLSCRAFPGFEASLFNRYSLLTKLFPNNKYSSRYLMLEFDHSRVKDVDWLSGACWLLTRRAYETIGPLDAGYFWTFEDVDYCQRAKRAGLRVVYFPDASIIHHIGGSSRGAPGRAIIARHRGMWRYYRSYMQPANSVARPLVNAGMAIAIGARCAFQLLSSAIRGAVSSGMSSRTRRQTLRPN